MNKTPRIVSFVDLKKFNELLENSDKVTFILQDINSEAVKFIDIDGINGEGNLIVTVGHTITEEAKEAIQTMDMLSTGNKNMPDSVADMRIYQPFKIKEGVK